MSKQGNNSFDPFNAKVIHRATSQSKTSDTSDDSPALETAQAMMQGLVEGAVPFKPQVFAAGEALAGGNLSDLEGLLSRYREAEEKNRLSYEKLMEEHPIAGRVGEVAGMFLDPVAPILARGVVGVGGKLIKPLMGLSEEEKALDLALKTNKADEIAAALERLNLKEKSSSGMSAIAKEASTGAILGGMYSASRSKGHLGGEGEEGLSGDIIEGAKSGAIVGGALGSLGEGFSRYFGKKSKSADIVRAVAGKELESGERLGVPVALEEGALAGKTFGPLEGPQLVYKDVKEKAKELSDRAVEALEQRKKEFNEVFDNVKNKLINKNASMADNLSLEKKIINAQGRAIDRAEKRKGRPLSQREIKDAHNLAAMNVVVPVLKQEYPELYELYDYAITNPEFSQIFRSLDKTFIPDLITGRPLTFSQLYNVQKRLKIRANELADEFKLTETQRDMLFGRGDYEGSGILYNQIADGVQESGLLEKALERLVPDVEKYRASIRDYGAGPIEAIINRNPDIAAQPVKAHEMPKEKIRQILEQEIGKFIETAGGTTSYALQSSENLNDLYRLLLKAEAHNVPPEKLKQVAQNVLDLKNRVTESSQNMAALVGTSGVNQAQGHSTVGDLTQAFTGPAKMFEGLTSLQIGRMAGKAKAIPKKIPVLKQGIQLRDASIDQLKEWAQKLSSSDQAWKANLGKSAMQGLEENPVYKGVFLNQIAQHPELRSMINSMLPGSEEEQNKSFNPYRGKKVK